MVKHINTVWLVVVVLLLLYLALNPEFLNREVISQFLNGMGPLALAVYIVLCLTRAALMIPSTPFILAGAVSFPDIPVQIFIISYVGILAGTLLIYSFPTFGSYDEYLEAKYPDKIAMVKEKMQGPHAFKIVVGWSVFPLVPTDLISYVAGIAKMPFNKLAAAVMIGELPIVSFYLFVGVELGEWLRL